MNRNLELNTPIDYDAYRARALELRQQEIDRWLDRFSAGLADTARTTFSRNRIPARPVTTARC